MPDKNKFSRLLRVSTIVPIIVLALLAAMILPIPARLVDILMVLNLGFAFAILLAALCIKKAAQFSLCPPLLVVSTLFNFAINVSAARLILSGVNFDGHLIRFAASWFIDSGEIAQLAGGATIFVLVLAVHTLLIIKGFTRAAKEAAGFTVDDMPTMLAAIDAELSDGAIGQEEYAARQEVLRQEANFYDSMDRATKFISGNEIFRLFIIAIIILGGAFIEGLFYAEPSAEQLIDAAKIYIPLVIGNGLLSMLPAFLVSAAVTILITRAVFSRNQ